MHARSPAEISFVRAFGYYLRGSHASVRLLTNGAFLRRDRRSDQSGKTIRVDFRDPPSGTTAPSGSSTDAVYFSTGHIGLRVHRPTVRFPSWIAVRASSAVSTK